MGEFLLLSSVLIPLIAVLLMAMGLHCRSVALVSGVVHLMVSIFLIMLLWCREPGYHFVTSVPCFDLPDFFSFNFTIGLDGISAPLLLLTSVVGLAAVGAIPPEVNRRREFYILVTLIIFGATGAFVSLDLFFLYIFHEVALIPTFLLLGIWGSRDRKFAATQITLYLTLGSLVLLLGLLAFYFSLPIGERTFDLREIQALMSSGSFHPASQYIIFILLLIGFGVLVSLWPFHSWAPLGYASAPAPVSMLHAGVLKKFGIYGLLRLASPYLPEGMAQWSLILQVFLLANILYIGWVTIAQTDLDMMLGYSSVMHMGYLFLGVISLSVIGSTGVVLLMVGHGLSTALLFGLSSEIRDRTGTLRFSELGGLAQKAPKLAVFFIIGGMASIGLPGLANFSGEILIFFGAWTRYPVTTALAILGVVLSAVYMLRAIRSIFFGEVAVEVEKAEDLVTYRSRWPYMLLIAGLVLFGVFPGLLVSLAKPILSVLLAG
ncbi:MAG: NADH-quinone oxidoreductase subunit M [Verrucomicrobiota bacterium]